MNSFFRAIRTFALVAFALTIFAGVSTFAQTFRGTILGSVTDSSGAAVPGATVTFSWRWPILGFVVAVAVLLFLAVTVTLSRSRSIVSGGGSKRRIVRCSRSCSARS